MLPVAFSLSFLELRGRGHSSPAFVLFFQHGQV